MPDINISGAVVQPDSPIYDGVSYAVSRLPAQSYRFQSSAIGDAPDVVLFRHFVGEQSASINLAPAEGEVGTLVRGSSVSPYEFELDTDGFTALSSRKHTAKAATCYIVTPPCREFRASWSHKIPNDRAFVGATQRETNPASSVWKNHWYMNDLTGGGIAANADLCLDTAVGGHRLVIAGNSSQPELPDLGHISNYWDWNGWNYRGIYHKADAVDPILNNGLIEQRFTSKKIGGSKTTGSLLQSSTVPVYGSSTTVQLATSQYDYFHVGTYFISTEGDYIGNAYERNLYLACGTNSRQTLLLLNAATIADSTICFSYNFDAWNSGGNYVDFTTRAWHCDITHAAIIKSDGSVHVSALADLEVL